MTERKQVKIMPTYLSIIFLAVFAKELYADDAMFSTYSNTLYLSDLKILGDAPAAAFYNVYLILKPNGQYEIYHYEAASNTENALLLKAKSMSCGLTDTFGRLGAIHAFHNQQTYCLSTTTSTTEGGKITQYLLIENGLVQTVYDSRFDVYSSQTVSRTAYTDLKFGYMENDIFIEQVDINKTDFNRKYILMLTGELTYYF